MGRLRLAMTDYRPIGTETPGRRSREEAPYSFSDSVAPVDLGLQHVGRLEHHHPARKDRHLDPGLGIAPHPLALGADDERAKAGQLDGFAARGRVANFVQNRLDQLRRLRARQSDLLINDFRQIGASHGLSGFAANPSVRHIEPHSNSPSRAMSALDRAGPKARRPLCPIRIGLSFQSRQSLRVEPIIGANENPRLSRRRDRR